LCEHFSDLLNTWLGLAWKHQEGCPEKSHQQNCFSANSLSGGYPDPALQFLHNPSRNGLKCSKKKPEMVELGTLILQFLHKPSRSGLKCSKKKPEMVELGNLILQFLHNSSRSGLKCSKKKPEMVELGTLILQFLHNPSRNGLDCSKKKSDMEELHLPNVAQQYLWLLLHSKMDSLYNTDLHSR
jgi:hypothetical protein